MRFRSFGIGMMLAAGMATGVAAHQSATKQTAPPTPQTKKMSANQTAKNGSTMLVGCLIRGPVNNTTSSTVVPPGTPPPPPMYKLSRIDANALNAALPEKARAEMSKETASITEVGLRASTEMNLAEHLDQKVEISGKFVAGKPGGKTATVTRGTTAATVPATAGIPDVPSFQVTSVRMLAATCQ